MHYVYISDAIYLHELLEGSDVYLPEAKVVQRVIFYIKWCDK